MAESLGKTVTFIATGEPLDKEMEERISLHKKSRPKTWRTLEVPRQLGKVIAEQVIDEEVVIIDCITLLVSNLMNYSGENYDGSGDAVRDEINNLVGSMQQTRCTFIIVSNEVGTGIVPDNLMGRIYRDLLGYANQVLARHAHEVYILFAGISVKIKG
jgi:adenosylcobinamide kinase/adenosylcobinamide-phosphate guanylyltransferase